MKAKDLRQGTNVRTERFGIVIVQSVIPMRSRPGYVQVNAHTLDGYKALEFKADQEVSVM